MADVSILKERSGAPFRLGRHIEHDRASLSFAAPVLPMSVLVSRRWARRIPVLDQGNVGACTGFAAAGWLGTDDARRRGATTASGKSVNNSYALDLYRRATALDDIPGAYPPDDTGSTGLGAAKALVQVGVSASYTHAFSLQALQSALQSGPVLIGIPWYYSMFSPAADGTLSVRSSTGIAGGHELCVDEIDMTRTRVGFTNSWGVAWGLGGRGFLSFTDLSVLLAQQGDVTIPAARTVAAVPRAPGEKATVGSSA